MNIVYTIFIYCTLILSFFTCTMELAPFLTQDKNKTIKTGQITNISQFSFENINLHFQKSSIIKSYFNDSLKSKKMNTLLSKFLTLHIALLPKDISFKIIKLTLRAYDPTLIITNDDKGILATQWAQKFYEAPLLPIFEKYKAIQQPTNNTQLTQYPIPQYGLIHLLIEDSSLATNIDYLRTSTIDSLPTVTLARKKGDKKIYDNLPICLITQAQMDNFQHYLPAQSLKILLADKHIRLIENDQQCIYYCNAINGKLIGSAMGFVFGLTMSMAINATYEDSSLALFVTLPIILTPPITVIGSCLGSLVDFVKDSYILANSVQYNNYDV